MTTNRQQMNDVIYLGQGEIIHAYMPSTHPIYQASNATEWLYNPTEGRNKLNAAGWVLGTDGWRYKNGQKFSVTLMTTSGNTLRQQATQIFKENLATCGVDVTLVYLPSSEFFANDGPVFGRKYDLAMYAWLTGIEPSCNLYLSNQIYVGGQNTPGYSNPAYDTACQSALGQLPGTTLYRDAHVQALEIWTQDAPSIPLLLRTKMALSNPNLVGVQIDSTEASELWNVEEWSFTATGIATAGAGGSLTSNDGRVVVQIPPGAFTESVTILYTPWLPESTGELSGVGQFFDLTALYESNGQPASLSSGATYTLTVTYSPSQLPFGAVEENLGIYTWNGSQWVREPTSQVNLANRTVTATPDHFSLWALLVDTDLKQIWLPMILRN